MSFRNKQLCNHCAVAEVNFYVFPYGFYAWATHGLEPRFLGRKRRECLIQLDQVVFWPIARAFVTIVNVK